VSSSELSKTNIALWHSVSNEVEAIDFYRVALFGAIELYHLVDGDGKPESFNYPSGEPIYGFKKIPTVALSQNVDAQFG
jgi:hypothetical protein